MDKIIRFIVMASVIAASLGAPIAAYAQSPLPPCQEGSLPSNDPQYPADQLILYCIPPNWNGQLVMYAHGYVPVQSALALPLGELALPEPIPLPDGTFMTSVPEVLMSMGFAFATTSYHKNGYAVEQARKDLNDLLKYFKTKVQPGSLQKVFLVGASEGGEIAALMIEHFPDKYAGALAMCGPIGGGPYQVKYLSDFHVVFNYLFPDVFPFGVADVPPNAFASWNTYMGTIPVTLAANPLATAQLYNISGAAIDPQDPTTFAATAVSVLFYNVWGTNDLVSTAGGMPYDNRSTVYVNPLGDAAFNTALNAGVERVESDGRARAYMRRFYQPTGALQRPLVTLHNTLDPVVPFQHEMIYSGLAVQAGNSDLLTVIPVPRYGHCKFNSTELLGAFNMLTQKAAAQAKP